MEELKHQIEEWLSFCARSFSPTTCIQYRCVISQLLREISANGKVFTQRSIENFLDSKLQQGYSRTQFNCYLTAIRNFASWRQQRLNIPSPAHNIPFIKQEPPKQRVLSEEEYHLCLKHTNGMDKDIIAFLGNTGLRREELRSLKWGAIDHQLKFIHIKGKGRKSRIVPLNSICKEILQRYKRLPDDEYVQFCRKFYGGEGSSWLCRKLAKKLNIPRFGCHAIRHRFATEMIRQGVNIYKLSKILGHSNITTTTAIYLHLAPVDLIGETDCLGNN